MSVNERENECKMREKMSKMREKMSVLRFPQDIERPEIQSTNGSIVDPNEKKAKERK